MGGEGAKFYGDLGGLAEAIGTAWPPKTSEEFGSEDVVAAWSDDGFALNESSSQDRPSASNVG